MYLANTSKYTRVSMRIRGYDESTGEYLGDTLELFGKVANATKTLENPSGISLFTDESRQTYKSTYQLFKDISEVYDDLTDKQQAQLLDVLGGKRNGQAVAALLNNFEAAEDAMNSMANSAGSAMREMGVIEESLEYRLNALKQAGVGIFQNLFQTDELKSVIDGLTNILEVIDKLTGKLGLLGTAIAAIGITSSVKGVGELIKQFRSLITLRHEIRSRNLKLIAI